MLEARLSSAQEELVGTRDKRVALCETSSRCMINIKVTPPLRVLASQKN